MAFPIVMWAIWGALVLLFVIIKIYTMGLSRDEDDQLVLQEGLSNVKVEQAAIVARLHKVEPIQRAVLWLLAAMSLFVIVYYVHDMIRQFQ